MSDTHEQETPETDLVKDLRYALACAEEHGLFCAELKRAPEAVQCLERRLRAYEHQEHSKLDRHRCIDMLQACQQENDVLRAALQEVVGHWEIASVMPEAIGIAYVPPIDASWLERARAALATSHLASSPVTTERILSEEECKKPC